MNLAQVERGLATGILERRATAGLLRSSPDGSPARLHVYEDAYRLRLIDALADNYPVLSRVLGDESFEALALHYLAACPSRHPSIRWFGHVLDDFLVRHPDEIPHPALVDLVRLEWALRAAFDGPDATPLGVADLMRIAPEAWVELRFAPHPTVALLSMEWLIEPIWHALTASASAQTEAPLPGAHTIAVWRLGLETHWRTLDPDECRLLPACLEGMPFGALCALAEEDHADAAATRMAGLLRVWTEAGMLVAFDQGT
jgi:hypothetical protein